MNDALVVYIHGIISKRDRQGRGSIDIDRYMEWNDIGLQTGPGTHNRRTEKTSWSSCPPQEAFVVPGFHNNKMDNRRQNSIEILLVHIASIFSDHCRLVRSNQSQVSTTSTGGPGSESLVDGYTWWQLAYTELTRDPLSRQHHQPAHRRQTYPNS
jgi:hypothetical protein